MGSYVSWNSQWRPLQGGHIPAKKLRKGRYRCKKSFLDRMSNIHSKALRYVQSWLIWARPNVNMAKAWSKGKSQARLAGVPLHAGTAPIILMGILWKGMCYPHGLRERNGLAWITSQELLQEPGLLGLKNKPGHPGLSASMWQRKQLAPRAEPGAGRHSNWGRFSTEPSGHGMLCL